MIIREANINDVRRLSYLIRKNADLVEENGYSPIQRKAWSAQNKPKAIIEKLARRKTFCAFVHGRLVGTIGLEGNLLCGMYISYSKRGKGIGKILLNYLENYAHEHGLQEIKLTASPNGHGFYLKNGYKPYGKMTHEFEGVKFPEIKMKKKI